jgi:hypothetical protein
MLWIWVAAGGGIVLLLTIVGILLNWAVPLWGEGWRPGGPVPNSFHCPACHHKMPESARQCPYCGCPFEN